MSLGQQAPRPILRLAERVRDRGGTAYLVGGGVRDHLMGLPVKDWDVEVFGLDVDALGALLAEQGSVNAVGRSFGVLKWRPRGHPDEIDVSIPRRDSKVGPGHRGIAVVGDPDMTLDEAARRRDLTINAISYDLCADRLVDPAGGRQDLAAGVLRAVDRTTFLEDPLRALRVVQFAARTRFAPDAELVALCREAPLDELPPERISGEWFKLLLKGRDLAHGFAVARATDVLGRVFPEVADLRTEDVLDRLRASRDGLEPEGRRAALMLAGWLHPAPPDAIERTLDRMWIHTVRGYPVRERTLQTCARWREPLAGDADLRRLSARAEVALVILVAHAVAGTDPAPTLARADALGVLYEKPPPLLRGRDLMAAGIPAGPEMGRILEEAWTRQLDGELATREQALEWLAKRR